MTIRIRVFVAFIISALLIGYILGIFFPLQWLNPNFTDSQLTKAEYLGVIVQLVSAIITFLAIVFALFHDEIKKIFNKVTFSLSLLGDGLKEKTKTIDDGSLIAESYCASLEILNNGNIDAKMCELYIEKARLKRTGYNAYTDLSTSNATLKWNSDDIRSIYIPSKGNKLLDFIRIICPERNATPGGEEVISPATLNIKGVNDDEILNLRGSGEWVISYFVNSSSNKPFKFNLKIKWDGEWQNRETEMKRSCEITII